MKTLPEELKAVIYSTMQRNGLFGHPENVLHAIIADEREEMRRDAWKNIRGAQEHACGDQPEFF